jgi:hypothetical protein
MKELLDSMPENIYPAISEYAKILLPAFFTYLVTRYTLTRPRKYQIKEKQFNLVYLPLYLLTLQYISESNRNVKDNISIYIKKVDKLIYKNYPYVYPKTLKLFKSLKIEASKSQMNIYFIANFEYQVAKDYTALKKELGYPSDSIITYIKHLNLLDKLIFFINLMTGGLLLYSTANFFLALFNGQISELFVSLFSLAFCAFIFYIFYLIKKH